MYNVYPYMYRNFRTSRNGEQESIGQNAPFKRGDLEGYVAAKDFASKPYAACTRAKALASINSGTVLRADMTPKEYINLLIRQGQVPDKHFTYRQTDQGYEICELNSCRETTKKVIFAPQGMNSETPIVCQYFTPDSGRQFREVKYHANGKVETVNDYEDIFQDDSVALAEMEKIEELRKAGPQKVCLRDGGNPFMQDVPLTDVQAPPPDVLETSFLKMPPTHVAYNPMQHLATMGL